MPTPVRKFRAPDETWIPAQEKTAAEGITVTDVLVDALERYNAGIGVDQRPDATVFVVRSRRPQTDKRVKQPWSDSPPLPEAEARQMFATMKRAALRRADGSEVQLVRRSDYVVGEL